MGLTSGTPIWLSILLALGAVISTHYLTQRREVGKQRLEAIGRWRTESARLLTDLTDAAITHYSDPSSLANTLASGQRLLMQLKRFGGVMREVSCVEGTSSKATEDLIAELHNAISGTDDFFFEARATRPPLDPLLAEIMLCDGRLRKNILLPRKLRI